MSFLNNQDLLSISLTNLAHMVLSNKSYLEFYYNFIVKTHMKDGRKFDSVLEMIDPVGIEGTKEVISRTTVSPTDGESGLNFCDNCKVIVPTIFKSKSFKSEKDTSYIIEYCKECSSAVSLPNNTKTQHGYWFRVLNRLTVDYFTFYPLDKSGLEKLIISFSYKSGYDLNYGDKVNLLKDNKFMLMLAMLELIYLPLYYISLDQKN